MAIAFDNGAVFSAGPISTAFSTSGSDRVLAVMVFNLSSSTNDPSVCTYGGVSLTKLSGVTLNSLVRASFWYLVGPASGSNLLVISDGISTLDASVISFTGGNAVQNFNSTFGVFSQSITVTSGASDMITAGCFITNGTTISSSTLTIDAQDDGASSHQAVGHVQSATTSVGYGAGAGTQYLIGASIVAGAQRTDYTLALAVGTFTLTGITIALSYGRILTAIVGTYIFTGNNINFKLKQWVNQIKNSSVWTDVSKAVTTWINGSK